MCHLPAIVSDNNNYCKWNNTGRTGAINARYVEQETCRFPVCARIKRLAYYIILDSHFSLRPLPLMHVIMWVGLVPRVLKEKVHAYVQKIALFY